MKTKTAEKEGVQGATTLTETTKTNGQVNDHQTKELAVVKKKMSVAEKLDSFHKLEALYSKVEYLRECKSNVDKFGTGEDGFQGAKIILACGYHSDIKISNPAIVQELVGISKIRVKEALIKAEKEVEEFEIA